MTLETETLQATSSTSTFEAPKNQQEFNWRESWYPVCFLQDLPTDRPYTFSLYEEPFVLFKDQNGQLVCLTDRCPHRAARLSDGQIIDGKIECSYHGWQFGNNGQCLHIPQLPSNVKIPVNACVPSFKVLERQGIIWMWAGEAETAIDELISSLPDWSKPECFNLDYVRDLPYDQSYFIENIIDPAHVPISHDGIMGSREDAQALELEVIESNIQGIKGRWRRTRTPNLPWISLDFIAPNLILYKFADGQQGKFGGTALYSIPLGKNRCRILIRNYSNSFTQKIKLMPPWLDHILIRNKILEGDLQLVVEQKAQIERLAQNLKEVYLPLKTSDTFVVEYRKWLDKFGSSLPFYQGYSTSKNVGNSESDEKLITLDRFSQHTIICHSCNQAYQVTNKVRQSCIGVAIALAAVAILADDSRIRIAAISASLTAIMISAMAQTLKTHFERSYTRH
ncbi:MAG: Rieske 2Fe-2S domain-containing protein [Nostoc sp. NMS1]|uniref:aromatic ring-hydroxylating dioxygenase subunit alpha n=1 Tax=unclassified Nostoc TaxID=2593658 RepID=UPI0025E4881F|nr:MULTISPECIES: Rieske 2Fe-2S domain-containing protein [unclassified Nostoc]MBN3908477.1 Rieske 2Fe-2S domain-containing protein [Nostoc sp. NMS1]MBN3994213.1 Rieske 2Fe-2S domain-containing protein [Nostoc sp. NMS2]